MVSAVRVCCNIIYKTGTKDEWTAADADGKGDVTPDVTFAAGGAIAGEKPGLENLKVPF